MFWLIQVGGAQHFSLFSILHLNLSTEPLIQKHQHWKLSQHKTSVLEGEKFNISDLEEAGHFPLNSIGE